MAIYVFRVAMSDFSRVLGVIWIFSGVMWFRRAYVGEKQGAMITLNSPAKEQSRRERVIGLCMAVMSFIASGLNVSKAVHG